MDAQLRPRVLLLAKSKPAITIHLTAKDSTDDVVEYLLDVLSRATFTVMSE